MDYHNIVKVGEKYPHLVKEIIGEYKVAYTPKEDPAYYLFVVKSDKIPKAFEGKFTVLKIKWVYCISNLFYI